jgi:hypothetical protein
VRNNIVYVEGATLPSVSLATCQARCQALPTCNFYTWNTATQVWQHCLVWVWQHARLVARHCQLATSTPGIQPLRFGNTAQCDFGNMSGYSCQALPTCNFYTWNTATQVWQHCPMWLWQHVRLGARRCQLATSTPGIQPLRYGNTAQCDFGNI